MDLEDKDLIDLIKSENDSGALNILMERHSGIFNNTVSKFIPPSFSSSEKQVVFEEKPSIFFEAIQSYDPTQNTKFITWLANKTRFLCLSMRTKESKLPPFCEFDDKFGGIDDKTPESYLNRKDEANRVLELIEEQFGADTKEIFKEKYFGGPKSTGKTFAEISKTLGCSPQNVQSKHSQVIKFFKKKNLTIESI